MEEGRGEERLVGAMGVGAGLKRWAQKMGQRFGLGKAGGKQAGTRGRGKAVRAPGCLTHRGSLAASRPYTPRVRDTSAMTDRLNPHVCSSSTSIVGHFGP